MDGAMIEAAGLVKHYGPVRAVDGVSFRIGRGEIVGFLGPNGAGKSTTMKMLTGSLVPDAGEVRVAGKPVLGGRDGGLAARASLGYLPEHTPLYRGMRVDRYLAFVAGLRGIARGARADAIERVVAACDLDGYVGRRIGTLSKGYRQRVGLAQALLPEPEVLILDEPTSGLDPAEIVRIRDLVVRLAEQATILLSTHVLGEIQEVCQRVVILAGGKVVADGSFDELSGAQEPVLRLTIAGLDQAEAAQARGELEAVPGVNSVRPLGSSEADRWTAQLDVADRYAVAARVSELARARGWVLLELGHELPSLESVFLARTRGVASGASTGS